MAKINNKQAISSGLKKTQIAVLIAGLVAFNGAVDAKKVEQNALAKTEVKEMIGSDTGCKGQINSPSKLSLPIGKSTIINLPEPVASRTVGNPDVLQAKMIAPQVLYLLGTDIGSSNMIIQGKGGTCSIIDVVVGIDPDALQQKLAELMPEEKNIKVSAAAESIVLSGTVQDALSASRAVDIAQGYVSRIIKPVNTNKEADKNPSTNQTQQSLIYGQYTEFPNPRVINLLSIGAQQQVMLEVKVAEVSKSLLDQLGAQSAIGGAGFKLLAPFFATSASVFGNLGGLAPNYYYSPIGTETIVGGTPKVAARGPSIGSTTGKGVSVDAQKKDGLVKILAEPSIMAISGQEGSFLAGGKVFIPVAQNNQGGTPIITLEEKEFGVGVKFTPTVLAGDRINLKVAPEVSELDKNGIGINATGFSGTAILPSFTTRRASTTVQLLDGQSFAIGGLIKNNTIANIKAFPILGEIPILGSLFRSTEFQKDKTELIFVVTPHLVKPLASNQVRLPTDHYIDPSRTDIFLNGKLEGKEPSPDAPKVEKNKDATKPNEVKPAENTTGFDAR